MSVSEPDIKDVFDKERAPKQTDNVSKTEPVFQALQEVKIQTANTSTVSFILHFNVVLGRYASDYVKVTTAET